jgi:hypothetical protein
VPIVVVNPIAALASMYSGRFGTMAVAKKITALSDLEMTKTGRRPILSAKPPLREPSAVPAKKAVGEIDRIQSESQ